MTDTEIDHADRVSKGQEGEKSTGVNAVRLRTPEWDGWTEGRKKRGAGKLPTSGCATCRRAGPPSPGVMRCRLRRAVLTRPPRHCFACHPPPPLDVSRWIDVAAFCILGGDHVGNSVSSRPLPEAARVQPRCSNGVVDVHRQEVYLSAGGHQASTDKGLAHDACVDVV